MDTKELPKKVKGEPVAVGETVRLVLSALVLVGAIQLDDEAIVSIAAAVCAVVSLVVSVLVRRNVTPSEKAQP